MDKNINQLLEALERAAKDSSKAKGNGPLVDEYYDGQERAFKLAQRYVKLYLKGDFSFEVNKEVA